MKILFLMTALLLTGPVHAEDEIKSKVTLKLAPGVLSDDCQELLLEDDLAREPSEPAKLPLKSVELQPNQKLIVRSCKIFWRPDIPAGMRVIGGSLALDGVWSGTEAASATLRMGHVLLGPGNTEDIKTTNLKEGVVALVLPIQNINSQNCEETSRLTSTLSVIVRKNKDRLRSPNAKVKLELTHLQLETLYLEPCQKQD